MAYGLALGMARAKSRFEQAWHDRRNGVESRPALADVPPEPKAPGKKPAKEPAKAPEPEPAVPQAAHNSPVTPQAPAVTPATPKK